MSPSPCPLTMLFRGITLLCLVIRQAHSDDRRLPVNFKLGAATSAYQIEGGWNEDGKGVSVWDIYTHIPGFTTDGSNGDVACDSYHLWEEDVAMLKDLEADHYRFSLAWTRIYPNGFSTNINLAGVNYYNNLIDQLIANGIEPVVTLYHWDLPQIFTPLGAHATSTFVNVFAEYARTAFELFGDRVKTWITFNEPKTVCIDFPEFLGSVDPNYPNGVVEYLCTYYLLQAHSAAYHIYNSQFRRKQQGKVGITLNIEWSKPASDDPQDVEAAEQRRQFEFGIFANPIVYGNYPKIVIDRIANRSKLEGFPTSRLPQFTFWESLKLRGAFDFLGLNNYNSWLVKAAPEEPIGKPSYQSDMGTLRYAPDNWEDNGWNAKITPFGMRDSLKWIKKTYNDPEILITECGYPDATGTVEDDARISFLQKYLNSTLDALIEDKVKITGFTVWSLMDNFEWGQGFTVKFGLYQVDFNCTDRTRVPKSSAAYFKSVKNSREIFPENDD